MNVLPILYTSPRRFLVIQTGSNNPPLETVLDEFAEDRALAMFRDELRDTKEIAWRLEATEAAVANGIANARERARARR